MSASGQALGSVTCLNTQAEAEFMPHPDEEMRDSLRFSLMRALWGEVHPQLRQASIEADHATKIVRVRFVYDGEPSEEALECGQRAGTEVIADFSEPWDLEEEHVSVPSPERPSALAHLVYLRWERERYR